MLRRARLLSLADSMLYLWKMARSFPSNVRFRSAHPVFATPPSQLAFDAYGYVDHAVYYERGERDARLIADIVNREVAGERVRICEWGCGPARVIRHLRRFLQHEHAELFGTDYNSKTISWCRSHIEGVSFLPNRLAPPLPFDAAHFDCVYVLSVFTHLSEAMHFEWIRELRRIVRPGGIVILTTHSDAAVNRLQGDELTRYNAGNLVVRGQVQEGKKWYLAYQPPPFMRNELLAGWDVISHLPKQFFGTQDAWVARRQLDAPTDVR